MGKGINPKVKDVLEILGITALIAGAVVAPPLTLVINEFIKEKKEKERQQRYKEWEKYNLPRLKQILKRLQSQKIINIENISEGTKITLTKKGRTRVLCCKLENMVLNKLQRWDKKWRLIIYDVPLRKKQSQENFRRMLKKLQFLKIQNSVYLTPYPCEKEIEFLRQNFQIHENIIYIIAERIENDFAYKKHFGLL